MMGNARVLRHHQVASKTSNGPYPERRYRQRHACTIALKGQETYGDGDG